MGGSTGENFRHLGGGYASAGTRTRVQALATPGDNHYTTLAGSNQPTEQGYKRLSEEFCAHWKPKRSCPSFGG